MPDQSYFDAEGYSRSELVDFLDSRQKFNERYVSRTKPREPSSGAHFEIGEQLHLILQEPDEFERRLQIIPASALTSNGQRRGHNWRDWLDDQPDDVLAMTEARLEQLRGMAAGLMGYRTIQAVLAHKETITEQPIFWQYTAANGMVLDLKCEPDLLLPPVRTALDVKTSKDEGEDFRWAVQKLRYWLQDAHYSAGIEAAYGYAPQFVFAVVSKKPPYQADLWEMSPEKRQRAARLHVELLNDLALCLETGDWSDPDPSEVKTLHVNF